LKDSGSVWTWGSNEDGQLGDGTNNLRSTPVQVKGPGEIGYLSGIVKIAGDGNQSGGLHTVALDVDANVWAWGRNGVGQLGDGTLTSRRTPVKVRE
jgi:alpha-tubulin suppressor-like RCC1 family protein